MRLLQRVRQPERSSDLENEGALVAKTLNIVPLVPVRTEVVAYTIAHIVNLRLSAVSVDRCHGLVLTLDILAETRPKHEKPQGPQRPNRQLIRPLTDYTRLCKDIQRCARTRECKRAKCTYCREVNEFMYNCWERPRLVTYPDACGPAHVSESVLLAGLAQFLMFTDTAVVECMRGAQSDCQAHKQIAARLEDFFQLQGAAMITRRRNYTL